MIVSFHFQGLSFLFTFMYHRPRTRRGATLFPFAMLSGIRSVASVAVCVDLGVRRSKQSLAPHDAPDTVSVGHLLHRRVRSCLCYNLPSLGCVCLSVFCSAATDVSNPSVNLTVEHEPRQHYLSFPKPCRPGTGAVLALYVFVSLR